MSSIPDSAVPVPALTPDAAQLAIRLHRIANPIAHCPGCYAQAGQPFPADATTRHCDACLAAIRSAYVAAKTGTTGNGGNHAD